MSSKTAKIENSIRIIRGVENIPRQEWYGFARSNNYASPFQSPGFYDFFNAGGCPQYANVYAAATGNRLSALCVVTIQRERGLKGFFSRRAIIYGGPLLHEGATESWRTLLRAIEEDLHHQVIYLEVRNFHDYRFLFPIYQEAGWHYKPYLNVQLKLEGRSMKDILANMKYNRRREIRQSLERGARYSPAETETEVRQLFEMLNILYQTRVKLPLPDYSFFRQFFLSAAGKVFIVRHKEKVIGGAFCPCLQGNSIYTFYYCGHRSYHEKIYPTHLAVLAAIDYGLRNDLKCLDFMGAGLKGEDYGVRQYKLGFGGELVEHGRFVKIMNPLLFNIGKLGLAAMQKINI
jgi:hypothetical protein